MPKRTMLALTLLCLILWDGLSKHGAVQVAAQATSGAPTSYSKITAQNANQLQELATLGRGAVNDMAWSPDGATLAVASATGIWLYDINALDTPRHWSVANAVISSVVYSPDGRSLVSGGDDGVARVWDVGSGRELHSAQVDHMPISKAAFSPDGNIVAVGENSHDGAISDGTLWLWNLARGTKTTIPEDRGVTTLAFNPVSAVLAFGTSEGYTWDYDIKTAQTHNTGKIVFALSALDFSRDGTKLAEAGGDDNAFVLNSDNSDFYMEQHASSWAYATAISPDGMIYAIGDVAGVIKIFSTTNFADPGFYFVHGGTLSDSDDPAYAGSSVSHLAFNPGGRILASAGADGVIRLWDVKARVQISTIDQHGTDIQTLQFSTDGKTLVAADASIVTRSWDVASGQQLTFAEGLQLYQGIGTYPYGESAALSYDTNTVARGVSQGGIIDFWDRQAGKPVGAEIEVPGIDVSSVAFSPDGKSLSAFGIGISIWDLATRKERGDPIEQIPFTGTLAFNAQGSVLAAGDDDGFIHLLNTQTGQQTGQISCSQGPISALAFDSTGTWLAAGGATDPDRTAFSICLVNPKTNKVVTHLQGHTDTINGLSFSPDGKVLASVSSDQTLRLWSPATGMPIATYRGHLSPIQTITFNPQGTLIATADDAGIIKIWGDAPEP